MYCPATDEWLVFSTNWVIFSYVAKTFYILMRWCWCPLCTWQHGELNLLSSISLKYQSTGKYVAPHGHIIQIPEQPVFVVIHWFCMLTGEATNQFYSLWYDPNCARTHDLPHSLETSTLIITTIDAVSNWWTTIELEIELI